MGRFKSRYGRALLILALALLAVATPAVPTKAVGYPSLTYVRYNRYGPDIYVTYCMAADTHNLNWGQYGSWDDWRYYGSINGCRTLYLFGSVVSGDPLYADWYAYSNGGGAATYWINLNPSGSANLTCSLLRADTRLVPDPRLNSSTACAFWDQ